MRKTPRASGLVRYAGLLFFVTTTLVAACGGTSGSGAPGGGAGADSCGKVQPCGAGSGGVVGTWKAVDACQFGTASVSSMGCTGATASITPHVTGSATLNADMSLQDDITSNNVVTFTLPSSCLTFPGLGMLSCAQLQMLIGGLAGGDAGPGATCTATSSGGCSCTTMGSSNETSTAASTYAVSGNMLTINDSSGMNAHNFCVQGSYLHLIDDLGGGGGGLGSLSGGIDIVFQKQ